MSLLKSMGRPASRRYFLAVLGLLVCATARGQEATGAYADLGRRLDQKIDEFDWAGGRVGAMVVDFRHGITVYRRGEDTLMQAGPVTQLVTGAAALESLGPDFRFATELFMRGEVKRGRLMGDLMIRGDGDPSIGSYGGKDRSRVTDFFDRWHKLVKKEGISEIEGGIWVDASAFDDVPYAAGWPVQRISDPRVPEISALNLNGNCLDVTWKAGRSRKKVAEMELFPPVEDYVYFSNNVRIEPVNEAGRRYFRRGRFTTIAVEGRMPPRSEGEDRVTVPDPALFFGHVFKTRLESGRVEVKGEVLSWMKAEPSVRESRGLRRLDLHHSAPLSELLGPLFEGTRTLDAEVLFKSMGRQATGEPGSFENGSKAVSEILADWGGGASGIVLLDGSGLSSFNRISAERMIEVLEAVHKAPWRRHFEPAVPRIPVSRVLEVDKPRDGPAPLDPDLVVYGVNGSFAEGYSTAGWAETRGRSRLHFAILVDGSRVPTSLLRSQVEVLLREIADTAIP